MISDGLSEKKRICAGVVTYYPDMKLLEDNLKALVPQVSKVFVIDNGSPDQEKIQSLLISFDNVFFACNKENLGVAKALNQLCMMAMHGGFEWILTMDQDSLCSSDMVEYLAAYTDIPAYGIIAPKVEFRDGEALILTTKDDDKETIEVSACITSGSLTKLDAWKSVGGFDEWFFIDRVDNEFCTHLTINGYKILRVNKAILSQRAGDMKYIKMPWGRKVLLPYYNHKRNYYICRNSIYYFRKYGHDIDLCHQVVVFFYSQFVKLLIESGRWSTFCSTIKGIRDGKKKTIEYTNYIYQSVT